MSRVFSAISKNVVEAVQKHPIIPIDFTPREIDTTRPAGVTDDQWKLIQEGRERQAKLDQEDFDKLMDLNLINAFHTHVMPVGLKLKLTELVDKLFKESPSQSIEFDINRNGIAISWLVSYGIVDSEGLPYFTEEQALLFCGSLESIVYRMCWEVLKANGMTPQAKREIVGNSDGTSSSSTSSESQAA